MLLKSKLSTFAVEAIVAAVSHQRYAGNLTCETRFEGSTKDGRHKVRFTLATQDSFGPGSRTSASGRHMPKASWHAHRDVMRAIFNADPRAFLHTALADYHGLAEFEAKFEATGDKNVGSMMNPVSMRETSL